MDNVQFDIWHSKLRVEIERLHRSLPLYIFLESTDSPIRECHNNLRKTGEIIQKLKITISSYHFIDDQDEIFFFKNVKPQFCAAFIYWKRLLNLYVHTPLGGRRVVRKYYQEKLKKLQSFFEAHVSFYEYMRQNDEYFDNLYFLRSSTLPNNLSDPLSTDSNLSTSKDLLVSEMIANELLERHLVGLLVTSSKGDKSQTPIGNLKWTGSRIGIVELIYALQFAGVFNNGKVEIKELAETFQRIFQIDLGNYYHAFNEIRLRKKNRTSLLDLLREKVIQKMDQMDER